MGGVCLGHPATIWCASFGRDPILVLTSMALDVPDNPAIHAIFLFLFVVSMLTLFLTVFCDLGPGICATGTKDGLKPVRTNAQPFTRYHTVYVSILYRLLKTLFGENAWIHFVQNAGLAPPLTCYILC
jgi:hypothetical protein